LCIPSAQCTFAATYLWRDLNIRVMSSTSFDGVYRPYDPPVRLPASAGIDSRGAVRGLLGMRKEIEPGDRGLHHRRSRGPRFVTKPGPVPAGACFEGANGRISYRMENPWVLNTWDRLMIPKPFSRALMRVGALIPVPRTSARKSGNTTTSCCSRLWTA